MRRGLGTPHPIAPLDDIEIELEDTRLGQRDFEARDDELFDLPERIVGRREVEILSELLRDRARAARRCRRVRLSWTDLRICSASMPS